MLSIFLLPITGLLAGVVNAIAGGGTLLSFPVLIWLAVPPVIATATLTALPGYLGSGWAYRRDIRAEGSLWLRRIIALAAIVAAGAVLTLLLFFLCAPSAQRVK